MALGQTKLEGNEEKAILQLDNESSAGVSSVCGIDRSDWSEAEVS